MKVSKFQRNEMNLSRHQTLKKSKQMSCQVVRLFVVDLVMILKS